MKVKLLKHLRKKFIIEYFPGIKKYKVRGDGTIYYFNKKSDAIANRDRNISSYGRAQYEKYSKRIIIK